MLPPHELKNKKFPLALRGYAQTEVNEHIDFIVEKYTELYRKNDELEKELLQLNARLEEFESKEDAINRALVSAQRIQERIISDAQLQAQAITDAAKKDISVMISEFAEKIKLQKATLHAMMDSVSEFKTSMLERYNKQISELNEIAPENADPDWDRSDNELVAKIMQSIRSAAEGFESSSDSGKSQTENISHGMGEFSGLSDEEIENTISSQIKRKRPKPAKTLRPKSKPTEIDVSGNEYGSTKSPDNTAEESDNSSSTDEELKKLFSDNAD